jgi:hypothetical protein
MVTKIPPEDTPMGAVNCTESQMMIIVIAMS